ncbi:hypothetical protein NWF32_00170 [Pseudomonas qingdaonensis]|nr:hypothetical protein [Pseudomonas qingdaonensis]
MLNDPIPSIRLAIGGLAHDTWDGWSIESDLLTPADAFELELHTKRGARLPEVIKEGAPCSLTLDGDLVLTGQVDEFEHDISRQGISMRINGRDRAAPLVDCSAPFVSMREASLKEIIDQVVTPWGLQGGDPRRRSQDPAPYPDRARANCLGGTAPGRRGKRLVAMD